MTHESGVMVDLRWKTLWKSAHPVLSDLQEAARVFAGIAEGDADVV